MKIQYPENWQVMVPQRRGQYVTIAPQVGIEGRSVGYGVVLNAVGPPNGQRMSIDDITRRLVEEMEQNEAMKPFGEPQLIAVAGVEGRSVDLHSVSPFPDANGKPQREHDWLITVPQPDDSVIFLIFVAPQAQFDRFQPTYEAMLKSLQF